MAFDNGCDNIGPIAGGAFPPDVSSPRAVSAEWFKRICPRHRRTRIGIKDVNKGLENSTPLEVMEKYVRILIESQESCVELYGDMEHPFDFK